MRVMADDLHRAFKDCQTVTTLKKADAERLMKRCLAQGWWFHCCLQESEYQITFSEYVDLDHFRRKLNGIQFTVEMNS